MAVPRGQMEAAKALGMCQRDALRYVIVPQAFRMVIPPATNDFISLLKDSSLVSVITMVELTKVYSQLAQTHGRRDLPAPRPTLRPSGQLDGKAVRD